MDFSPKGEFLIATKGASLIHAQNAKSANVFHQGHYRGELWALATQTGQEMFVTGGDDGTVRLWDIQQKREVNRIYFDHKIRGIDCSN